MLFVLSTALMTLTGDIEVATAGNGREALKKVREGPFDLMITDINMPDISGIELTEQVRTLKPDMPVVWITGFGASRVRDDCVRLDVYKCLDKPVKVSELRKTTLEALQA